ncbi:hypothetical protein TNCV_1201261 [Trichonephila clavipes]|nr:hypothetical protein TNCV_1201261 [Trichonephila clavipes]
MSYNTACSRSLECLFGLDDFDKIKFLVKVRIVRVQVPPRLVFHLFGAALKKRYQLPGNVLYVCNAERRLSESIGAGHRSDNRKPNAIHAVYATGPYTNIENHHMWETCLKKKQNVAIFPLLWKIIASFAVHLRFYAARSLILLSKTTLCCSYHSIAVSNTENASALHGPLLLSLLLWSSSSSLSLSDSSCTGHNLIIKHLKSSLLHRISSRFLHLHRILEILGSIGQSRLSPPCGRH